MTLSTRLKLTAFLSALLTITVGEALYRSHTYQQKIYQQLTHSMKIQLAIDTLRSHLWLYEEYSDNLSLEELNDRQARLAQQLTQNIDWDIEQKEILDNLTRLNTNIRMLFNTQIIPLKVPQDIQLSSQRLLKSKYSMNLETMTEYMLRLQQVTITKAKKTQQSLLISISIVVLILSIVVTLWSSITLLRFKQGMTSLNKGMKQLAKGDLESRIQYPQQDEFADMVNNFNMMKTSLQNITIRKDQLKLEVEKQTQKLTEQQVQLTYLAEHDELTSIYNRRAFIKQIEIAITRASRRNEHAALLFIDLNKFKIINDTLGHHTGDEVIKTVAQRLKSTLRSSDIVGRFGGDEFVIWLDYIEQTDDIIAKINEIIDTIKQPINIDNEKVNVGSSIGVSLFPADGKISSSLITAADTAMYIAKNDPKTEYYFFNQLS
ncbi:diguanylate cyclase domain-containing protein [Shewanella gaetbuli]|uniref:Diguanylate cyclase n=1 Tax=Shewanella gaetbuli TaxID=220752 RepID=A0A9X1ZQK9_9GAMM|nr:diguanylate cyclase [Shewanella gaetbuli]MCL1143752.1 diguanylate cyclase [Shewanella gaetbuli]